LDCNANSAFREYLSVVSLITILFFALNPFNGVVVLDICLDRH